MCSGKKKQNKQEQQKQQQQENIGVIEVDTTGDCELRSLLINPTNLHT